MVQSYLLYDRLEFLCRSEGKAVQNGVPEGSSRRLLSRFCPIDAGQVAPIMSAICIFLIADDNTRVEERAADCPQYCRDLAGREEIVDVYDNFASL